MIILIVSGSLAAVAFLHAFLSWLFGVLAARRWQTAIRAPAPALHEGPASLPGIVEPPSGAAGPLATITIWQRYSGNQHGGNWRENRREARATPFRLRLNGVDETVSVDAPERGVDL